MKKIIIFASLLLLISCSSEFKRTLGLNKTSPNEYEVLRHPALSMPPNDYLAPPSDSAQGPDSQKVQNETGEEILLNKEVKIPSSHSLSSSDRSFIEQTSHVKKDEKIKNILERDGKTEPKKKSILNLFKKNESKYKKDSAGKNQELKS